MLLAALTASLLTATAPITPALAQSAPRASARPAPVTTISLAEMQKAQQQHPDVVKQFGGAADPKLTNYVAGVGRRVAANTNVANAASVYKVTVLNSPVRNAFAVPGGYVYVTRELLALMNSEDELAFVLGHEMGHVAARHGQKRQTRSTISTLGAAIAQVLTGSEAVGQIASQVGQGVVLGYSRAQENEADTLGERYMIATGYDPYAAPRILSALGAAETMDATVAGQAQVQQASWTRSHPLSAERVQRTTAIARQAGPAGSPSRDRYLAAIDGMVYGDDPRQGIVDGRLFRHGELRFKFTAPEGFTIENGVNAVTVSGSGGQAQFGAGRLVSDTAQGLGDYVGKVFGSLGGSQTSLPAVQTTTINGLATAYATTGATANRNRVDVTVVAYRWSEDLAYHFVLITPSGTGIGPFQGMIRSFAPMLGAEVAALRPRVIDVVNVTRGDTPRSLSARMAFGDHQLERFLVLNGLEENSVLAPGTKVKLVVYAPN
ncbi:M48 family metalloprotease [Novosphingobium sp. G106]|nr:M48 family metalloprotease [Novosphingobium sp. G106]